MHRVALLLFFCVIALGCISSPSSVPQDFCSAQACIVKTITGLSMEPTIHDGERIRIGVDYYSFFPPQRGDIVIIDFNVDGNLRVKRLVGLPGDSVHLDKEGNLAVNGTVVLRHAEGSPLPSNSFVFFAPDFPAAGKIIPPGRVMVLADNSAEGADSRNWGFLDASFLAGKVLEILPDNNAA